MLLFCFFGLFCAGMFFVLGYTRNRKQIVNEYFGICKLLTHMRGNLNTGAAPIAEALEGFECSELENCGVLNVLKGGASDKSEEYVKFSGILERKRLFGEINFIIDKEDKDKFIEYLSSFGAFSLEEEILRLGVILEWFENKYKNIKDRADGEIKSAWVIFSGAFASALILAL